MPIAAMPAATEFPSGQPSDSREPEVDGMAECRPGRGPHIRWLDRAGQVSSALLIVPDDPSNAWQVLCEKPGDRRRRIPQLPREREVDERGATGRTGACPGSRLLVVVRPAQARDVQGLPGPRDRDVDESASSTLRACCPPSSSTGGPKPGPMRTLSHSRPFALCAVETVTSACSP